jgi:hypothetical protein
VRREAGVRVGRVEEGSPGSEEGVRRCCGAEAGGDVEQCEALRGVRGWSGEIRGCAGFVVEVRVAVVWLWVLVSGSDFCGSGCSEARIRWRLVEELDRSAGGVIF